MILRSTTGAVLALVDGVLAMVERLVTQRIDARDYGKSIRPRCLRPVLHGMKYGR
jgi:hypothetical protein